MKKIIFLLGFVALFISCKKETKNNSFVYTGSNWENYEDHKLQISVADTVVGGLKIIAEQIIKDGQFKVSGDIEYIRNAYFGLYNPEDQFVYKKEFILEPGNLNFTFIEGTKKGSVSGGKYNDLIHNFSGDPEFLSKQEALSSFAKELTPEDYQKKEIRDQYGKISADLAAYKFGKYIDILEDNRDPIVKVLLLRNIGILSMMNKELTYDYTELLNELETTLGSSHPEVYVLRSREKTKRETEENTQTVGIGSTIKNFSAKDLNDTEFELTNVLSKNKYVLVEFWASWCGPCRVEIPHMKEAYKKHKKNGFEIVSFTLDHVKDRWIKASKEENLPWINVGDLKAHKSPIVKMYGVRGVPANFLVDQSGTIIAKHLRQEKLDEKLEELLVN